MALLFGLSAIFLTGRLAMGLLVSIVTKSQLLSSQVAVLTTFLPGFLLSGFIFTIANMPQAIQMVTYLISAPLFRHHPEGHLLEGRGAGDPRRPGGVSDWFTASRWSCWQG